MLANLQIDHEVQQRPFEPGTGAFQEVEAGGRDLDAALEIEKAELGAELVVRLWLERHLPPQAPLADGRVRRRILSLGNGRVRGIGHFQ